MEENVPRERWKENLQMCDVKQAVKWKVFKHMTECNTNK